MNPPPSTFAFRGIPGAIPPTREDNRIILHFDYDAFYASVEEAKTPALRDLPLAIQQKQIVVTANYVARRHGVYKLMTLEKAREKCPGLVVRNGERLDEYRNISKRNARILKCGDLTNLVQRLGFDEVFLDVTDIIDHNIDFIEQHNLGNSPFYLSKKHTEPDFYFDARLYAGSTHIPESPGPRSYTNDLAMRLRLGSHLAMYLRIQLEMVGFTCTAGIATSKLLAKLVGALNKPRGQTTFIPPHDPGAAIFMSDFEIAQVPGIGKVMADKLREAFLGRPATYEDGLVDGLTTTPVTVKQIRSTSSLASITQLLSGPYFPKDIGQTVWGLVWGVDNKEVTQNQDFPRQISIEDTYLSLRTRADVIKQLEILAFRVLERMEIDLTDIDTGEWAAFAHRIRVILRPRLPVGPDGTRERDFRNATKSDRLPKTVHRRSDTMSQLAKNLANTVLINVFDQLHPPGTDFDLQRMNVGVYDIRSLKDMRKNGADITKMFKNQPQSSVPKQAVPPAESPATDSAPPSAEASPELPALSVRNTSPSDDLPVMDSVEPSSTGPVRASLTPSIPSSLKPGVAAITPRRTPVVSKPALNKFQKGVTKPGKAKAKSSATTHGRNIGDMFAAAIASSQAHATVTPMSESVAPPLASVDRTPSSESPSSSSMSRHITAAKAARLESPSKRVRFNNIDEIEDSESELDESSDDPFLAPGHALVRCVECGSDVHEFNMIAHQRYHFDMEMELEASRSKASTATAAEESYYGMSDELDEEEDIWDTDIVIC